MMQIFLACFADPETIKLLGKIYFCEKNYPFRERFNIHFVFLLTLKMNDVCKWGSSSKTSESTSGTALKKTANKCLEFLKCLLCEKHKL